MLFNSIEYLIFLPTVLLLYWILSHRLQNWMLLGASYLFYGWWDARFLFLIALSTGIDYLVGLLIDRGRLTNKQIIVSISWILSSAFLFLGVQWKKMDADYFSTQINQPLIFWQPVLLAILGVCFVFLISVPVRKYLSAQTQVKRQKYYIGISVISNLSLLGFFKYFNFFIDSAEGLIRAVGGDPELFHLGVVLPVGISFYTFQTMSYSFDIYRKKLNATTNFPDFALFVSFFPQLVAGPIERASHLLPSILAQRSLKWEGFKRGCYLILYGLFKKVAIADGVAGSVNSVYNTAGNVSWLDILLATFLFAVQIYCDFSAYSDIARGSAKLLGIDLMRNFNLPYFSMNPSEFWRRWHISLSSWLRDYLYIPLGGSRGGLRRTYQNLSITMLLGGLWHGAAWNFILWGAYQGAILSVHRFMTSTKQHTAMNPYVVILKIMLFFIVTCYGWLLFRATSFNQIIEFSTIIVTGFGDFSINMKRPTLAAIAALPLLLFFEIYEFRTKNVRFYEKFPVILKALLFAGMFMLFLMGLSNEPAQFIYFQF